MIDMLRASIEEAQCTRTREDCLDYIAKRTSNHSQTREKRIGYVIAVLEDQFLPHIGLTAQSTLKKAYFVGYMVNRLLTASLGRATEDDRDYYGKSDWKWRGLYSLVFTDSCSASSSTRCASTSRRTCNRIGRSPISARP